MKSIILSIITISTVAFLGCESANTNTPPSQNKVEGQALFAAETSDQFNAYWFAGKAEISSYNYTINRYGQDRKGYAVFIFVTEDLSNTKQVKLDDPAKAGNDRVPVLKLNAVQRFKTGIYDYSMMSSLFTPIDFKNMPHALKSNTTVQDWCGQVFTQMNLRGKEYKIEQYSYFETEGDQKMGLNTEGVLLEDELLSRLRLDPSSVPTKIKLVPNLTFSRLRHKKSGGFARNTFVC
ncbi:MAG: hypothetical protein HC817_13575 [Saprospiraceae bacterium]|nr:hypothetical protein [Saprospiraceae bacterium]